MTGIMKLYTHNTVRGNYLQSAIYNSVSDRKTIIGIWRGLYDHKEFETFAVQIAPAVDGRLTNGRHMKYKVCRHDFKFITNIPEKKFKNS